MTFDLKHQRRLVVSCIIIFVLIIAAVIFILFCHHDPKSLSSFKNNSAVTLTNASSTISTKTNDNSATGEKLRDVLKAAIPKGSNIIYFYSGDLEGNGKTGAFAFVGKKEVDGVNADLWYIHANSAKKVYSSFGSVEFEPKIWSVGNNKMLKVERSGGGSGTKSLAWIVKNGNPVECGIGMELSYLGDNRNFEAIGGGGDFDGVTYISFDPSYPNSMTCCHTYKEYYFYWDGERFKEYGGIKITLKQLSSVSGAAQIINQIKSKGYQIGDIFYRGNNIININYSQLSDQNAAKHHKDYSIYHENATLLLQNHTVRLINAEANNLNSFTTTLEQSDYHGIYKAAFYPDRAVYPGKFPVQ